MQNTHYDKYYNYYSVYLRKHFMFKFLKRLFCRRFKKISKAELKILIDTQLFLEKNQPRSTFSLEHTLKVPEVF